MRVYGMPYRETMGMPMRAFWHVSGTVPRLLAGERKDTLELMTTAAHNPQAAVEMYANLGEISPEPVTLTPQAKVAANSIRDEAGFADLRNMA